MQSSSAFCEHYQYNNTIPKPPTEFPTIICKWQIIAHSGTLGGGIFSMDFIPLMMKKIHPVHVCHVDNTRVYKRSMSDTTNRQLYRVFRTVIMLKPHDPCQSRLRPSFETRVSVHVPTYIWVNHLNKYVQESEIVFCVCLFN